jgi:predicted SAM-dependent methyltransferase
MNINLGCGNLWKADWRNLDGGPAARLMLFRGIPLLNRLLPRTTRQYPRDLVVHDLRKTPLPFPDQSAASIFSGYAFEYISVTQTRAVLKDCWRILKPGGLIRLCQTDIATIVEAYVRGGHAGESAVENADQFLKLAAPQHRQWSVRMFRRGGVQQLFDKAKIEFLLAEAGFCSVLFYSQGEGECPDLKSVERAERIAAPLLHVEARKANAAGR